MNRVTILGRLTKDVEINTTQSGKKVCNFIIAVNRRYKKDENEADFITCVAWNKTAENIVNHLNKGSLVGIDGRLQSSSYTDEYNRRIFKTDVMVEHIDFLDSKKKETTNNNSEDTVNGNDDYFTDNTIIAAMQIDDDEFPFD